MNPTSLKQPVNGLAELVVHIRWCERHLTRRDDIDDYVQKQHFYMHLLRPPARATQPSQHYPSQHELTACAAQQHPQLHFEPRHYLP
ncbi:MAG: hypothetical protein VYB24_06480 [Pseudomonadota bacterium]|nr:hypothetical protein [Pseudomonadota bacterium]